MFITIDSYYDPLFYNQCLSALENNGVSYNQAFYVKGKVFEYCINVPYEPLIINYDVIPFEEERYIINHVIPLDINEIAIYQRRIQDSKTNIRKELYLNDALMSINDTNYGLFLNLKNKEQAQELSKEVPVKLYYLGKYLNGRYKVFFSNSIYIESFINNKDILLKKENETIVQFEQRFNFKVLERKEKLIKYSKTPYFENGIYTKPQYQNNRRFYVI